MARLQHALQPLVHASRVLNMGPKCPPQPIHRSQLPYNGRNSVKHTTCCPPDKKTIQQMLSTTLTMTLIVKLTLTPLAPGCFAHSNLQDGSFAACFATPCACFGGPQHGFQVPQPISQIPTTVQPAWQRFSQALAINQGCKLTHYRLATECIFTTDCPCNGVPVIKASKGWKARTTRTLS